MRYNLFISNIMLTSDSITAKTVHAAYCPPGSYDGRYPPPVCSRKRLAGGYYRPTSFDEITCPKCRKRLGLALLKTAKPASKRAQLIEWLAAKAGTVVPRASFPGFIPASGAKHAAYWGASNTGGKAATAACVKASLRKDGLHVSWA